MVRQYNVAIKSSRVAASFREISRQDAAFMTSRWFRHICFQVTSLHKGDAFESVSIFDIAVVGDYDNTCGTYLWKNGQDIGAYLILSNWKTWMNAWK